MSNPYLSNSSLFGKSKPREVDPHSAVMPYNGTNPYGNGQSAAQGGPFATTATQDRQFANVEQAYYGPAAGAAQTGRLTYDDVLMKTAGVIGTIVVVAFGAWFLVPSAMIMPAMGVGALGGFVLALVNIFKKEPSPALIMAYAVFEGVFLGMISGLFELLYPGIVVQAVLATFITFGVTLVLYKSGKVRVTPKFIRFLMIGLISYGLFSLVNLGIMLFTDVGGAFGVRDIEILGIPIGLVIGAVAVVLAAMSLILDFDQIHKGVQNGVARKYAWTAAFGLAITLVWLYVEFLRLIAILRGD